MDKEYEDMLLDEINKRGREIRILRAVINLLVWALTTVILGVAFFII